MTTTRFKNWLAAHVRARHIHQLEVLIDNLVGLALNFFLVFLVYNLWQGQDITVGQNLKGTLVFFTIAYIRKYTLRRWSSSGIKKLYEWKEEIDAEVQKQTRTK